MEQGRLHLGQRGYSAVLVVAGLLYLLLEHNTTPTLLDDVVYRFQLRPREACPRAYPKLGRRASVAILALSDDQRTRAGSCAGANLSYVGAGTSPQCAQRLVVHAPHRRGRTTHCAAEGRQGGLRRAAGRNYLRPAAGLPGGVAMAAGHAQLPLADRPPSILSTLIEKTTAASPYLGLHDRPSSCCLVGGMDT